MAAYATSTDVKQYLGINSTLTGDDTLITALILRAQTAIDTHTHRTFSSTAAATRRFTVGLDTFDGVLWFDEDIYSVSTVKTNADSTAPVTVASTEYVTLPRNRTPYYGIKLRSDADVEWDYADAPEMGITVAGRWAYSATPPADIKHACVRLASYYYQQKDAQVYDVTAMPDAGVITVPQGVPADVKEILKPYVKKDVSVIVAG
jgi:hypothetical protein